MLAEEADSLLYCCARSFTPLPLNLQLARELAEAESRLRHRESSSQQAATRSQSQEEMAQGGGSFHTMAPVFSGLKFCENVPRELPLQPP
ncbi:hypothetical protein AOLI_G00185110 [Acnodon oligacanthus]